MRTDVALGLLAAGTLACVLACLGALATRRLIDRVHFLAPITSLGAPLIAAGCVVRDGLSLASGEIILIASVLALSGAALSAATGRLVAQAEGDLRPPEARKLEGAS